MHSTECPSSYSFDDSFVPVHLNSRTPAMFDTWAVSTAEPGLCLLYIGVRQPAIRERNQPTLRLQYYRTQCFLAENS